MSTGQILGLWGALLAVMLACRCLPLLYLRGRELPPRVKRALGLIPPSAFAALVANDLFKPDVYATDPLAVLPVAISSLAVVAVARRSGSLLWSALVGMACYALLTVAW